MVKRKEIELFIDSILDHANSIQSLNLIKDQINVKIQKAFIERRKKLKSFRQDSTIELKKMYYLRKRIEIILPCFIANAIEQQNLLLVPEHERTNIYRYRCLCLFKLKTNDLPYIKGYDLLVKYGYYSPSNLNGVVKDHRLSIKSGFLSKVNPKLMSHPCNCEFLPYNINASKSANSSINLMDLQEEVKIWNNRIGIKTKRWKTFT